MLLAQPVDYLQYFVPFQFDAHTVFTLLSNTEADVYMGIFWEQRYNRILYAARLGWQGYEIPAYGVVIDHKHRNRGLGRLSLETSKVIARLRGAKQLMLKVHPENSVAKELYEAVGFVQTGVDAESHHLIYHFDL